MIAVHIHDDISIFVPTFKIGIITYNDIVITTSPQMIQGRLQYFQEAIKMDLQLKSLADYEGISEWRQTFQSLQINPNKYPPSHEALYSRIQKGNTLPSIHSAVDLNTFFSLQYVIPFGIYDAAHIQGDITIRFGNEGESYEGINRRVNNMQNKLISADALGPFGSPIVDSIRTSVTLQTKQAVHLVYVRPSMEKSEALQLLQAVGSMFTHIHGGDFTKKVVTAN